MTAPRPHAELPSSRLSAALRIVLLGIAASGVAGLPPLALAQQGSASVATRFFDIPGGPLDVALDRFARAAAVNVSYDPALLSGATTRGVRGTHDVNAALAALLAGSGIDAQAQAGGGFVLRRAAAASPVSTGATLPTVHVTSRAETSPEELPRAFPGGQVARGARLGMLGNTDIFETPFSTKAYTAEFIRNQGARNVNDMVANDPSIRTSLSATSPLDQSSIRGFLANSDAYLFNGLEGLFAYSNVPIQNFERLEVLKGPAAGLVGASGLGSTVGGSFNLVPKRATDDPVRSVTVSATDKSLLGTQVDLGQRFGVDKQIGVRLNVSAEDGKLYDGADRSLLAPQLALDYRGHKVRVTVDAGYVRRESSPLFNHWLLAPGANVPTAPDPKVHPKPSWENIDMRQTFGVIGGEWDFAERWTAYARHGKLKEDPPERFYIDQTTIDGNGNVLYSSASSLLWTQVNEVSDAGVRGDVQWGGTRHRLSAGVVGQRQQLQDLRSQSRRLATPVLGSIYRENVVPNPFAARIPIIPGVDSAPVYLNSYALADTMSMFDERLFVTVAARHQEIKQAAYKQSEVTPTVGALYRFANGISLYGNYAESLAQGAIAPAGSRNAGEQLPPYVSRQHELGAKWDRGTYGLTAAYFDIRRATAFVDPLTNVFSASGQQQNKGVEVETFGEIAPGVRLLGGVAWIDGKMTRTAGGLSDGHKPIGVPGFTANLGAEVDVAGVPGLSVNGRFIYTGSAYVDLANTQRIPSWHRVDVGARYATRVGTNTLTLRAGIINVLDDTYWTIAGRNFISVAPPRTWMLSASMDF